VGEADDQPHIALRDHDGSDHGPGDAAYAVRAGGRLDARTIRVARERRRGPWSILCRQRRRGLDDWSGRPAGAGRYLLRLQADAQ